MVVTFFVILLHLKAMCNYILWFYYICGKAVTTFVGIITFVDVTTFVAITTFVAVTTYVGIIVQPLYNEVLGTMKITLLYQVSHYIRVKKQRKKMTLL